MAILPGPRVISIKQPWAWAIAAGHKKVENREWKSEPKYIGTVYIHASSGFQSDGPQWLRDNFRFRVPDDFVQGAIVAVAKLVGVAKGRAARSQFGIWYDGDLGLVLKNVRKLKRPVPTKGKLGLWTPSPALKRAVERQLK